MIGLDWPEGFPRTAEADRNSTSKFSASTRQSKSELKAEMSRVDPDDWALDESSGSAGDPGVVLRWVDDGRDYAVACDHYTTKKANLRCVFLWLRETRKRNDRPVVSGTGDGFAAAQLPSGEHGNAEPSTPSPHEVLGVAPDAPDSVVQAAARQLKKEHHPDAGGSREQFQRINEAEEAMLDE